MNLYRKLYVYPWVDVEMMGMLFWLRSSWNHVSLWLLQLWALFWVIIKDEGGLPRLSHRAADVWILFASDKELLDQKINIVSNLVFWTTPICTRHVTDFHHYVLTSFSLTGKFDERAVGVGVAHFTGLCDRKTNKECHKLKTWVVDAC